ncbi:MAG: type II toxin-antitoxin system RelE/ParE family toxin [Rhodoglobus sp.]
MAERYTVELTRRAQKELHRLDRGVQERIVTALGLLRDHPRPPAAKALVGHPRSLRVRVGGYRIVYTVDYTLDDGRLLVLVLTTGHRRAVYDSLP